MNADAGDTRNQPDRYAGRSFGNGRYVLRDLLGEGGMASVHLGHDTVLDRPVAVKTLHTDLGREQSFRERFRREAQAVARLNHTNIVSVFDSGEDSVDGGVMPYIVMEYVEGKPLRTVLDEDVAQFGAMPTEKALKICGDVLAALSESHSMGLVHRDIKPGNVMITKRGVVKVMDFGIARAMQSGVTSMTQTGMVVGTPQYLSPEQALGRAVDERSDLYSVGCMLFELLTGRLPFDGDSPLAIAYQHVQEVPPMPSQINQAVPPGVDALVSRALKKKPSDRFPNADIMRDEADRVRQGSQSAATPLVISEGPRARKGGEGVASAVFPPVQADLNTPPPQVMQPYQSAYAPQAPHTPPPAPRTPPPPLHTPLPVQQSYGFPHQTPPPQQIRPPMQQPMQQPIRQGPPTPAPAFTMQGRPPAQRPQGSSAGRTVGVVIACVVGLVVLIVFVLLIIGLSLPDDPDSYTDGTGASVTATYTAEPDTTYSD